MRVGTFFFLFSGLHFRFCRTIREREVGGDNEVVAPIAKKKKGCFDLNVHGEWSGVSVIALALLPGIMRYTI